MKRQKETSPTILSHQLGMAHSFLLVALVISALVGMTGYMVTRMSRAEVATNVNVGTYNLRSQRWDGQKSAYDNWSVRAPRVKAQITSASPGIIGMQEVIKRNPDTLQYVSQRNDVIDFMKPLGYNYFVGDVDNSSSIFWKSSNFDRLTAGNILIFDPSTTRVDQPRAARYLSYVRLRQIHDNKNILVFNYHFNQLEQESEQLQKLGNNVASIRSKYPGDDIFFTGDFNKRHDKIIAQLQTKNIYLRSVTVRTTAATAQDPGIDHVLVSKYVALRSWYGTGLGSPAASDHPLVIAKLTI